MIPTVGAKDLHVVQLAPGLRKLLHHRAVAAERRAYKPILKSDRGAFGEANRAYQLEKGSAQGAAGLVQGGITQALAGLKGSGLTGGALRQAQSALTARSGQAAEAIPYLLADAGKERTEANLAARQQLTSDRAQMEQGAAQGFNSLLASARSTGSQGLKEQEEHKEAEAKKEHEGLFDPKALSNARLALKAKLTEWMQNPVVPIKNAQGETEEPHVQEINPLASKADWLKFAQALAKEPGFDLSEANHVIHQLLKRRQEEAAQNQTPAGQAVRNIGPWG
jgi:hypothetical protein